jgi:hypothetical protein
MAPKVMVNLGRNLLLGKALALFGQFLKALVSLIRYFNKAYSIFFGKELFCAINANPSKGIL